MDDDKPENISMISRNDALLLMQEHISQDNLRKHCLATEAIMRKLARKLGYDQDLWGIAGLLHDLDYSETKDNMHAHGLVTERILKEKGVCEDIINIIKSHNADNLGFKRQQPAEHAIAAAECITGLIVATALVYPDKQINSVRSKSIIKRMKQKEFARSVNREFIMECEKIGIPIEEFSELSLEAMKEIHKELGL